MNAITYPWTNYAQTMPVKGYLYGHIVEMYEVKGLCLEYPLIDEYMHKHTRKSREALAS